MMNNKKNRFSAYMMITALFVMLFSFPVMAGEIKVTDSSGNVFLADGLVSWEGAVGNEIFAAGRDVSVKDADINGSAFLAGYDVSAVNDTVGGSIFAAGYTVTIDADINNNVWAVGNKVSTKEETRAKALHIVGTVVNIDGEYDGVAACGDTVIFNAKVDGNVAIEASTVKFGDDAEISGELKVISAKEPVLPDGDKIGEYVFEKKVEEQQQSGEINGVVKKAAKVSIGMKILKAIKSIIYWIFAFAILALVFRLILNNQMDASVEMVTKKSLPMLLTGFLGIVCVPIVILVMFITVIGAPLGGLSLAAFMIIKFSSVVFAFGSYGRHLLFGKLEKRLNPVLETVISVLPMAVIRVIPLVGWIVKFACFIYTLGFALQSAYNSLGNKKEVVIENSTDGANEIQ